MAEERYVDPHSHIGVNKYVLNPAAECDSEWLGLTRPVCRTFHLGRMNDQ